MIYVFAADKTGCGSYRMIWPAQALIDAGHDDIRIRWPGKHWEIGAKIRSNGGPEVVDAVAPDDATTIVIQRPAHAHLTGCIEHWQRRSIRVVVDVDDSLSRIDPNNSAWEGLRPKPGSLQSWNNLAHACRIADAVTVTTPALAAQYRPDATVIPNYLWDTSFGHERVDSSEICWPAALPSHPNDAVEVGGALDRVSRETSAGLRFIGDGPLAEPLLMRAFSLSVPPRIDGYVSLEEYPAWLASIGIGVAPLANTKFNACKSALKPAEMMAAGVPFVASPRADYLRLHQETGVGLMARKPNDWYRQLKRLVQDPVLRKEQSEAGREAAESLRLRDHAWKYLEVWRG